MITVINCLSYYRKTKRMLTKTMMPVINCSSNYRRMELMLTKTMITLIIWATSWQNLLLPYATNKCADLPLISAFVVHCLYSMIFKLVKPKISRFYLVSVAEQVGLSYLVSNSWRQVFLWHGSYMSHHLTKPTKWRAPREDSGSALASTQSNQSALCAQWVAKDSRFLHVDSDDSDQTGWMPRLIWDFSGHTCHFVHFIMIWLIWRTKSLNKKTI